MDYSTNFFKKVITSIYDIKVFSKYTKEGFLRSISYAVLLSLILATVRCIFIGEKINNFELKSIILTIVINFRMIFFNLLFNCLVVVVIASIFTIFMKMVVKYIALYSLTLYAATLPLIIKVIFEVINPSINFDTMFLIGTLTYVTLILKYIKDEILKSAN